jgi:hypothetical protein
MTSLNTEPNLFEHFIDPVDMVMCCPANQSCFKINEIAGEHTLRFPLHYDLNSSLAEHLKALEFAEGSTRFGSYLDNILGMNWQLSSGRVVRIGEQVVKSTTGYDLFKFLLHSDGKLGHARDYVIRLRPEAGDNIYCQIRGDKKDLHDFQISLINSPWIHWIDSLAHITSHSEDEYMEIFVNCIPSEKPIFENHFATLSNELGVTLSTTQRPQRSLPVLTVKTTISETIPLAEKYVQEFGGSAVSFPYNGVVLIHNNYNEALHQNAISFLEEQTSRLGGGVYGHRQDRKLNSSATESLWVEELKFVWNRY